LDFDLLQQVAIGQLGMTEDEFWDTRPRAFFNAVEGFESLRRTNLEIPRLQTLYIINMWSDKPIRDPRRLWVYPWEKSIIDKDRQKVLAHRAKRVAEKFDRIEKRHGG